MGQLSNQDRRSRIRQLHGVVQGQCSSGKSGKSVVRAAPRRRQHRLSTAQVIQLTQAYQSGTSLNDLAEHFKVHRSTVLDHLNRADTPRRRPALSPSQIDLAIRLYRGGQSLKDVGVHFGAHASTVRTALLSAGVAMRDCQGRER